MNLVGGKIPEKCIYVNGRFVETARCYVVRNPYDGTRIGEVGILDIDSSFVEEINRGAIAAMENMEKLQSWKKYEILMEAASRLAEIKEEVARLISVEVAKPIKLARIEVERAINTLRFSAEEARRIPSEVIDMGWAPQGEGLKGLIIREPAGIVMAITPFNFPLNLALHKVAPAIAAGCPVILKPSPAAPFTALVIALLFDGLLPEGALSVINIPDNSKVLPLLQKISFHVLSFTGSSKVGWLLKRHFSDRKVILELGGNAGMVVEDLTEEERLLKEIIAGAFAYSGQVCIHLQRLIVNRKHSEWLSASIVDAVKSLRCGNPLEESTDLSVMINEESAMRVREWIKRAIEGGASVMVYEKIAEEAAAKANFVSPCVLENPPLSSEVWCEEVFGPVLSLIWYENYEDGIRMLNDTRYGLQASVWTREFSKVKYAMRNVKAGVVLINKSPGFRVDHMPFGGWKKSGTGIEGVKYAIEEFSRTKCVVW